MSANLTDCQTEPLGSGAASTRTRAIVLSIITLLVCNLVVFAQVVTFDFLTWDDQEFVVLHLKRFGGLSAEAIAWAFTNCDNGWRTPVPYLSLFLDAQIFGLNPAGYHLTNLLIHTASTLILFDALRRMTHAVGASFLAAVIFAIHPLHVEPVAWVTARWELLCGFFWVAGMWAYGSYCRRPTIARYLPVAASYVLALASKPMALTFPFALLLLDYWPLRRFPTAGCATASGDATAGTFAGRFGRTWVIIEKLPLFVIGGIAFGISWAAKGQYLAQAGMHRFSWSDRLGNALETYASYAVALFRPSGLSYYYPHPALFGELTAGRVAAAGALVGLITLAAVLLARRLPCWMVGWFWFLGVFVPAIGLVQVEHHARADRYTYLPLIGLAVAVSWAIRQIAVRYPRVRLPLVAGCVAGTVCMLAAAHRQTSHWRDSRTLFTYAVSVDQRNFKATVGLGDLAYDDGDFRGAETWYRRTLAALPGDSFARYKLGRTLYQQNKTEAAVAELQRALDIDPRLAGARRWLAIAAAARGDDREALRQYREIVRLSPQEPDGYVPLAKFLARKGDFSQALVEVQKSLELAPQHLAASLLVGQILIQEGRAGEAAAFYESSLRDYPHRADVANELAWLRATYPDDAVRRGRQAVEVAWELCRRSGFRNQHFLDTLAAAYAEAGRFSEAAQTAADALRLAREAQDEPHARVLADRLAAYRQGKPFRDISLVNPPPNRQPVATEKVQ